MSSRLFLVAPCAVALLFALAGCESESGRESRDDGPASGADRCERGTRGCPCPDAGDCRGSLTCRGGTCRSLDIGSGREDGDADDSGDAEDGRSLDALFESRDASSLTLQDQELGPEGVRTLVSSERVSELTRLNLAGNELGDEGARLVANSEHLKKIEHLNLADNAIGPDGAEALAGAEHLGHVKTLDLSDNELGDEGAKALVDSELVEGASDLEILQLAGNGIGSAGTQAISGDQKLCRAAEDLENTRCGVAERSVLEGLGDVGPPRKSANPDYEHFGNAMTSSGVRVETEGSESTSDREDGSADSSK